MTRVEELRLRNRERAHGREANFGSGRVDGLSKMFGKLKDEYAIYETNASALGWRVKSFNEWLNS